LSTEGAEGRRDRFADADGRTGDDGDAVGQQRGGRFERHGGAG
jgi:hypothetical protein